MKNDAIKNLKSLHNDIKLSSKEKSEVGDFLMAQVSQDMFYKNEKPSFWLKMADHLIPASFEMKPVAVFALILFLFGSVFTSIGAPSALPGDALYSFKLTGENIRYNVFTKKENKSKYAMTLVETRVNELKQIVTKEENGNKSERIAKATKEIENSLNKVTDKINVEETYNVVMAAQEVEEKLEAVKEEIKDMGVDDVEDKIEETNNIVNLMVIEKISEEIQNIEENELASEELKKVAKEAEVYLAEGNYEKAIESIVTMNEIINLDIEKDGEIKGDNDAVVDNDLDSSTTTTQPVINIEPVSIEELLGIEEEKKSEEFKVELK